MYSCNLHCYSRCCDVANYPTTYQFRKQQQSLYRQLFCFLLFLLLCDCYEATTHCSHCATSTTSNHRATATKCIITIHTNYMALIKNKISWLCFTTSQEMIRSNIYHYHYYSIWLSNYIQYFYMSPLLLKTAFHHSLSQQKLQFSSL